LLLFKLLLLGMFIQSQQ